MLSNQHGLLNGQIQFASSFLLQSTCGKRWSRRLTDRFSVDIGNAEVCNLGFLQKSLGFLLSIEFMVQLCSQFGAIF